MALDEIEQRIVADTIEYGWSAMHVLPEGNTPGFTYSIGFWESVRTPEFLIYGLPRSLMHSMLWEVFRQLKAGREVSDGARVSDLVEGFDCIIRPVHNAHLRDHVGFALWYQRHKLGDDAGLQAWQIFWPGKQQGLFPWQVGCHPDVRNHQPILYLPSETGLA